MRLVFCAWLSVGLALCAAPEYELQTVHVYPHDADSFTQGLEFHGGLLYEGTGRAGHSQVRVNQLESGKAVRNADLEEPFFGEGITLLNGRLLQLTWLGHKGFIYDAKTLRRLGEFSYPGQGWGLTNDGQHIYMSDGSSQIRVWDGQSLQEIRRITVRDGEAEIDQLNELEWVRGEIYANVWHSDRIARISPADGRVLGWINASGLLRPEEVPDPEGVLNGIAFDDVSGRLFLTGKLWPKIFEVRVVKAQGVRTRMSFKLR